MQSVVIVDDQEDSELLVVSNELNIQAGVRSELESLILDSNYQVRVTDIPDSKRKVLVISNRTASQSEASQHAKEASHEVKNSLAIIIASVFISKKYLQKDEIKVEKLISILADVEGTSQNIVKIMKNLQNKIDGKALTFQVSIDNFLKKIDHDIKALLDKEEVTLKVSVAENTQTEMLVETRGMEINQIIINLTKNSIEAFKEQADKQIDIKICVNSDNELEIIFKDNGPGVPEELQEKIFERDFSTKSLGDEDGIGLYLCRKHLVNSGGTLNLLAENEKGMAFKIKVPISSEK